MILRNGGDVLLESRAEAVQIGVGEQQSTSLGPVLGEDATLNHLGYVVASIAKVAQEFAMTMGLRWNGKIIHDPLQRVRVSFFRPADPRNPVFELVEPASEISPVTRFLKKGGGFHHVCYEIDDLELGLQKARSAGFVIISPPTPAVAFDGRRIAWICSRSRMLIELLERHSS